MTHGTPLDTASHRSLSVQEVHDYLERHMHLAPGTKTQYGHPSPRFWSEWSRDTDELLAPRDEAKPLALYLHVPFCPPTDPPACGFCLFAREDLTSHTLVSEYVDHLLVEVERVGRVLSGDRVDCVYVGGGTPNLLRPRDIERLLVGVRTHFDVDADAEVTFEGYPSLFTLDRLEACVASGVTRISIGVQQLDERLLAYSGRRCRPEQVEETVRFCREHGLRCSADLISGWFEQTTDDVLSDIERLTEWGVTGIVNHPLTLAGDSPFARRAGELPTNAAMCATFLAAREHMLSLGYRADSYTDYVRRDVPVVRYLEMYRRVLDTDRVGVGYGANSVLTASLDRPGHTHVNVASVGAYRDRVEAGGSSVDRGFRFDPLDLRLLFVLKGLEGSPYLRASEYARRFGGDLRADFADAWTALEERGWLAWEGDDVRLAGDGVFYTATIQRCLAEPRNRRLRAGLRARAV